MRRTRPLLAAAALRVEGRRGEVGSSLAASGASTASTKQAGERPSSSTRRRPRSRDRCTWATSSATRQTDVLARHQRMRGGTSFYPMGWDDNGLPTERRVQNYFHVRCEPRCAVRAGPRAWPRPTTSGARARRARSRAGTSSSSASPSRREDEKAFKTLWQRLGLSVDWSLEYSTISDRSRRLAQLSFLDLLPQGPGLQRRGAHDVGRGLPHRGGPGRGRGPAAEGRLPRHPLRRSKAAAAS